MEWLISIRDSEIPKFRSHLARGGQRGSLLDNDVISDEVTINITFWWKISVDSTMNNFNQCFGGKYMYFPDTSSNVIRNKIVF